MYERSIFERYARKRNDLVCGESVKNVIIFYSLKQYLLFFTWSVAFALCLLNRFVMLYFPLRVLNSFMCCRCYTQNTIVVVHCVKVLHSVLDLAYQYFVFFTMSHNSL